MKEIRRRDREIVRRMKKKDRKVLKRALKGFV